MNIRKFASLPQLLVASLVITITACADDPLKVGLELIPEDDLLNAKADTFEIECFTFEGIPGLVNYTGGETENFALGYVIDPVFGETSAEAIMQLNYNTADYYGFDKDDYYDKSDTYVSCKLYLNINTDLIFGGQNGFDIDVYLLKRALGFTNYTNYSLKSEDYYFNQEPVSIKTSHKFQINHKDISGLDSGKYFLVVELDKAYAERFMDTTYIKNNDLYSADFTTHFPGFYLQARAKNGTGGLNNFYPYESRLVLEYTRQVSDTSGKSGDEGEIDTTYLKTKYSTFSISKNNTLYRHTSNNTVGGPFSSFINDTTNQQTTFNVQSLGGVRGYFRIKGLDALRAKSDSIGINFAELVFPINEDYMDTVDFTNPLRLTAKIKLSDDGGYTSVIEDQRNAGYFNGYFNKKNMDYRINLSQFVHQYVYDSVNFERFYLMSARTSFEIPSQPEHKYPGRVVLNSGIHSNPSFLRVIYTKINR